MKFSVQSTNPSVLDESILSSSVSSEFLQEVFIIIITASFNS